MNALSHNSLVFLKAIASRPLSHFQIYRSTKASTRGAGISSPINVLAVLITMRKAGLVSREGNGPDAKWSITPAGTAALSA